MVDAAFLPRRHHRRDERGERGVYNAAYAPLLFGGNGALPHPGAEQATLDALEAPAPRPMPPPSSWSRWCWAGGMLMYPPHVLAEMAAICRRHGVLLIADEVMTGWGRTGTLLACEQAGVAPDILCLAKGLTGGAMPLAVTLASEAIYDAHYATDRARTFYHSSSFTANPLRRRQRQSRHLARGTGGSASPRSPRAGRKARPCWRR
jgi:adenosylmethionine-8-amino-7-oxononanoate aminotransferase